MNDDDDDDDDDDEDEDEDDDDDPRDEDDVMMQRRWVLVRLRKETRPGEIRSDETRPDNTRLYWLYKTIQGGRGVGQLKQKFRRRRFFPGIAIACYSNSYPTTGSQPKPTRTYQWSPGKPGDFSAWHGRCLGDLLELDFRCPLSVDVSLGILMKIPSSKLT